jgi:hypothetical protein
VSSSAFNSLICRRRLCFVGWSISAPYDRPLRPPITHLPN